MTTNGWSGYGGLAAAGYAHEPVNLATSWGDAARRLRPITFGRTRSSRTGGPELERALEELGGKIAGRLGVNATGAGARVIAAEANRRAPAL